MPPPEVFSMLTGDRHKWSVFCREADALSPFTCGNGYTVVADSGFSSYRLWFHTFANHRLIFGKLLFVHVAQELFWHVAIVTKCIFLMVELDGIFQATACFYPMFYSLQRSICMKFSTLVGAACLTSGLVGCGGSIKYVDITQSAPIAVIGFSLDKSIVEEGKERNSGPGLLQKAQNYYKHHQEAIDALWSDFKSQYRDLFLGADAIDVETVASDAEYKEMTKHVPKMMMGTDIAPGSSVLAPNDGLNFVNSSDNALLEKLAAKFNAKLLMGIDYSANYSMTTGVKIGPLSGGAAKLNLKASVFLFEAGKGVVMQRSFEESSDESYAMVQGELVSENYAKGLSSAQKKILPQIKQYFEMQKTKANEVVTK